MSEVATKVLKPKVAPRAAMRKVDKTPKALKPKEMPVDRTVPEPDRATAPVVARQILEHVYWLGWAVKNKDQAAIDREFDSMKLLAKMYCTFASSPSNRPIKYSSDVENYPPPKKTKNGKKIDEMDDNELDEADQ